jgi:hypothetical protein
VKTGEFKRGKPLYEVRYKGKGLLPEFKDPYDAALAFSKWMGPKESAKLAAKHGSGRIGPKVSAKRAAKHDSGGIGPIERAKLLAKDGSGIIGNTCHMCDICLKFLSDVKSRKRIKQEEYFICTSCWCKNNKLLKEVEVELLSKWCPIPRYKKNALGKNEVIMTMWAKMYDLFKRAKKTTKERNRKPSRILQGFQHEAPEWESDEEFRCWAVKRLQNQFLLCFYSHRPLTIDNMSMERKDETKGYSSVNCVFILKHLQSRGGPHQWSRPRFLGFLSEGVDVYDEEATEQALQCAELYSSGSIPIESREQNDDKWTEHASLQKAVVALQIPKERIREILEEQAVSELEENSPAPSRPELQLRYKFDDKRSPRNDLFKFFRQITRSSKRRAIIKNEGDRDFFHDVTLSNFLELWRKQEGKCYYTGRPMAITPKTPLQCSPERLDNRYGYVQDNVALIALECNNQIQWDVSILDPLLVRSRSS